MKIGLLFVQAGRLKISYFQKIDCRDFEHLAVIHRVLNKMSQSPRPKFTMMVMLGLSGRELLYRANSVQTHSRPKKYV